VHGSTQEITVVAKMIDDGTQGRGITGMNCIRALVSNRVFFSSVKWCLFVGSQILSSPRGLPIMAWDSLSYEPRSL